MASITVTLGGICPAGGHLRMDVTGAKTMTVNTTIGQALDAVTDQEAELFVNVLIRLAKVGRTNAQLRTLFQAGVTVTV